MYRVLVKTGHLFADALKHGAGQLLGHDVADERLGGFGLRTTENVNHRSLFHDNTFVHDGNAIANLLYHIHLVGDHDDRQSELFIDAL